MNLQNGFTTANIGQINHDLAVKSSRAEERRVKNIRPVRRGNDDDAFLGIETVHLDEQRIERLFAFIVAATEAMSAASTYCVNFVDENQAGRILARLLEHIPNGAGAPTADH